MKICYRWIRMLAVVVLMLAALGWHQPRPADIGVDDCSILCSSSEYPPIVPEAFHGLRYAFQMYYSVLGRML